MDDTFKRSGNSLITNGVLSFLAGFILLFLTGISQQLLVIIFAAYAVIFGFSQLAAARGERSPENSPNGLRAIGIFSIIAGVLLLLFMNASLPVIILLIAAHALITGVSELIAAWSYREEIKGDGWYATVGAIRIIFGLFLIFNLGMSLSTLVLAIAWYAIVVGPILAVFGYSTRTKEVGYRRHLAH